MLPEHDTFFDSRRENDGRRHWFKPARCSICTSAIWFAPILLKEPDEAPRPHLEWVLCKTCHRALLVEVHRSSLQLSVRLRVAIGLVASERSPHAYTMNPDVREQMAFQREFIWAIRLMIFFALFHLVIFAIVLAVPR